jgi:NAD(P) transhydrogenase subunit alpha
MKTMKIGVLAEQCPNETRVALTPANASAMVKRQLEVVVQQGAGIKSGHADQDYLDAGAQIVAREEVFSQADVLLQVQSFGANKINADQDLDSLRQGQMIVGMMDPLASPETQLTLADKGVTTFALELIPRISRAQSMDVLSSMATIGGYKAVLQAATESGRIFPMLMTAAGTLNASKVLIMGAGVAGLQAAATAKRLGGVVSAYDVREAAREQILSVGAKVVDLNLPKDDAEGRGGYAKAQRAEAIKRQQEAMKEVVAQQDIIITTAAVPGAKSPILVTEDMVKAMKPGSVIVDLAAERGGNCELTEQGKTLVAHGVIIVGPENLPASVPHHASQLYGKNVEYFLNHLFTEQGELNMDLEDEIIAETLAAHNGDIVNNRLRGLLNLDQKLAANA